MTITAHASRRIYGGATHPAPLAPLDGRPAKRPAMPLRSSSIDRLDPNRRALAHAALSDFWVWLRYKRAAQQRVEVLEGEPIASIDASPQFNTDESQPEVFSQQRRTRARQGSTIQPVLTALASGPMTLHELMAATGLTDKQIKSALEHTKGRYVEKLSNKTKNNKWALLDAVVIEDAPPPLIRERIDAFLAEHGPHTARQLADTLGVGVRSITAILQSPLCRAEKMGMDGRKVLWGAPKP